MSRRADPDDAWEPAASGCPVAPAAAQQSEHAGFLGALDAHLSAYEAADAAFNRQIERCRACQRAEFTCPRHTS